MAKTIFVLSVEFDPSRFEDNTIRGIVGKLETGSGTNLVSFMRDMSFEYASEKDAKKALERIKKKKVSARVSNMRLK